MWPKVAPTQNDTRSFLRIDKHLPGTQEKERVREPSNERALSEVFFQYILFYAFQQPKIKIKITNSIYFGTVQLGQYSVQYLTENAFLPVKYCIIYTE